MSPVSGLSTAAAEGFSRVRQAVGPLLAAVHRRVASLTVLFGPLTSSVTLLGWIVVAGAVVGSIVGWNRGWLEFRTLGLLLGIAAGIGLAFMIGRGEYTASLELGDRRVRIGQPALGRAEVRNVTTRPASSTSVELPVGRNVATFRVPRLGVGEAHEELFGVPTRRRGVITVGPVRSVRSDPLGLFRRERTLAESVELFVHPDTVPLDTRVTGFLKDVEGVATQNLSSSDVSFHALREYVPGDDRRAVHWRTTARVGKVMVRQFEETMRAHLLLVLSLEPTDYVDEGDLELAISVVGSLALAALHGERPVSVVTADGLLRFSSAAVLLDELCRIEARPGTMTLRELAALAATRVPSASVVGLVTGGAVEPSVLRGAHVALPPEVSTIALRCGRGLVAARRKASELVVLDVPTLADLQRGMGTIR